ncbi:hypothetical protein cyc_02970 [Cyclospora cayetanensis]|uniref:Uncharacterized protein n=1 Tax=Cyclospora cayetanensis TaxID=88456 RepID=A0A1D3CWY0_9EIME|nr:hypothetical protein cyc_02970 [Cyclospora cayetanensis]
MSSKKGCRFRYTRASSLCTVDLMRPEGAGGRRGSGITDLVFSNLGVLGCRTHAVEQVRSAISKEEELVASAAAELRLASGKSRGDRYCCARGASDKWQKSERDNKASLAPGGQALLSSAAFASRTSKQQARASWRERDKPVWRRPLRPHLLQRRLCSVSLAWLTKHLPSAALSRSNVEKISIGGMCTASAAAVAAAVAAERLLYERLDEQSALSSARGESTENLRELREALAAGGVGNSESSSVSSSVSSSASGRVSENSYALLLDASRCWGMPRTVILSASALRQQLQRNAEQLFSKLRPGDAAVVAAAPEAVALYERAAAAATAGAAEEATFEAPSPAAELAAAAHRIIRCCCVCTDESDLISRIEQVPVELRGSGESGSVSEGPFTSQARPAARIAAVVKWLQRLLPATAEVQHAFSVAEVGVVAFQKEKGLATEAAEQASYLAKEAAAAAEAEEGVFVGHQMPGTKAEVGDGGVLLFSSNCSSSGYFGRRVATAEAFGSPKGQFNSFFRSAILGEGVVFKQEIRLYRW